MKGSAKEAFLYVAGRRLGPVKIGVAVDVAKRLALLQTGNPYPIEAFFTVEVGDGFARLAEAACHKVLSHQKMIGEWFDVSSEDAIAIVHDVLENRSWELKPEKSNRLEKPEMRSERIAVMLSVELRLSVEQLASAEDLTISKWIERAIRAEVERRKRAN